MTNDKIDLNGESSVTGGSGVLRSIAIRPSDGDAMTEVNACEVLTGGGLVGENRPSGKREVTLLSAEAWNDTCRELKSDLPWTLRRANLLVDGIDLAATPGRTIAVGEVRIQVHGETRPCGIMDKQHAGLRAALVPDGRGGVTGEILAGGTIRVGDAVEVLS